MAVIGEVFVDKLKDRASDVACKLACVIAGYVPDDLPEAEADQFAHERHNTPPVSSPRFGGNVSSVIRQPSR